ncbi:MAG: hydantoinase B/oxoprolinase family protein, partial [Pseudomonadota bacterium]
RVSLASGAILKGKGFQMIPPGERLVVETPGGGGIGDPAERTADRIDADRRAELVTEKGVAAYAADKG